MSDRAAHHQFIGHAADGAGLFEAVIETFRHIEPVIFEVQALQPRITVGQILRSLKVMHQTHFGHPIQPVPAAHHVGRQVGQDRFPIRNQRRFGRYRQIAGVADRRQVGLLHRQRRGGVTALQRHFPTKLWVA